MTSIYEIFAQSYTSYNHKTLKDLTAVSMLKGLSAVPNNVNTAIKIIINVNISKIKPLIILIHLLKCLNFMQKIYVFQLSMGSNSTNMLFYISKQPPIKSTNGSELR